MRMGDWGSLAGLLNAVALRVAPSRRGRVGVRRVEHGFEGDDIGQIQIVVAIKDFPWNGFNPAIPIVVFGEITFAPTSCFVRC